ncbi:hypothetical protein PF005_g27265 [Phytophthora fragariae]|uniref:CCHC-type domain-containing protein n=1 Tax=Phytophthora fragariae TaxID=53985 RepID=A0A6A4BJJ4_9STRA|nr:hypothetical protein PF003_g32748 [Phytophthora fragariae]KAE8925457.1 hypothetical protein PF009_g24333 [Phytophthora fragariae]KAE8970067.1 hypothetical protein PF011_g26559 [Phytophthora fragariae]KAE9068199.1 hypothetical protein PF010_g27155 [Phytophthora fragariae]KAE9080830.1 hypothetical protein PF007_g22886 [Phytophthora fragariae]
MRRMMLGETHADIAAGLRAVVGRNKVSERVLLAQFYRCLYKTTKKLVKQRPKPETLEEAVDKATEIDDPMDNVAQGMMNIGQSWATAPSRYVIPMTGTTGATNVIPGISGTGMSLETIGGTSADTGTQPEVEHVALFTNPQGVYNVYSGMWDPPPGHTWNGKYWKEPRKSVRKSAAADSGEKEEGKRSTAKLKRKKGRSEYSGDEAADSKQRKVVIAPVKQAAGQRNRNADNKTEASEEPARKPSAVGRQPGCFRCGKSGHWATNCPTLKCYACGQLGHMAHSCTDEKDKARNDEYLRTRVAKEKSSEN